jgi:hypothetical protein
MPVKKVKDKKQWELYDASVFLYYAARRIIAKGYGDTDDGKPLDWQEWVDLRLKLNVMRLELIKRGLLSATEPPVPQWEREESQ